MKKIINWIYNNSFVLAMLLVILAWLIVFLRGKILGV